MSQLVLADGVWVVDLVAEDQEGDFGEVFHREQGVELGFRFGEALVVFGVDEKDDAGHFGEVVAPEAAGWGGRVNVLDYVDSPGAVNAPC